MTDTTRRSVPAAGATAVPMLPVVRFTTPDDESLKALAQSMS